MRGVPPRAAKAALCLLSLLLLNLVSGCVYLDEELALDDEAFAMNMTEDAYLDLEELEIRGRISRSGCGAAYGHASHSYMYRSGHQGARVNVTSAPELRLVERLALEREAQRLARLQGAAPLPAREDALEDAPSDNALLLRATGAQRYALARAGLSAPAP